MTYGGSVHIDTDLWIYLPTPPVFFMSLDYPFTPFCSYFSHNSYGWNSTPIKMADQKCMLPSEFLYQCDSIADTRDCVLCP